MDFGLKGRLCLVTGSTSGIGRAIALALGRAGGHVLVHGRNVERTAAAAAALASEDGVTGKFTPVTGDLSTGEGAAALIAAVDAIGELEVLVNNVGIFEVRDFTKATDETWIKFLQANLMSVVRMSRHYLPKLLAANKHGRIINIASEAGWRPIKDMIVYSTTKSAVIGLSRGLAELTQGKNVTVNSMLVGPTMTAGVKTFIEGVAEEAKQTVEEATETYFKKREPTSLIQRFLKVEEVAAAVLMVASVPGAGINGSAQRVEGGIIRSI